jgi:hypothetical protein
MVISSMVIYSLGGVATRGDLDALRRPVGPGEARVIR